MNILIVEDDQYLQEFNATLMDHWGFEADIASDGIEAVEYSQRNNGKYDLCLMDIDMPKMNGIEATREIRDKYPYFPIMALTANANYKSDCFSVGMDEFVQKPYSCAELLTKINELTVKLISIENMHETLSITRGMPMNSEELQELRELKKKGLTKLKLIGLGYDFIVHKNIQNKIAHDLIGEGKELSEFIDRSPSDPGRCHLYKVNLHVTKDLFIPEELKKAIQDEDELVTKLNNVTDMPISNG